MNVLVTGANGFIGRALCSSLAADGHRVVASLRRDDAAFAREFPSVERRITGDICADTHWDAALADVEAVVHLANLAHVGAGGGFDVNVTGTRALAAAAAAAGVRRLVYVSSIKVHGELSGATAFAEASALAPETPYARSKLGGERALEEGAAGALELVVLRPPLVYGPRVRANFLALMRALDRGWPIPVGPRPNARDLVYVGNLADAIRTGLVRPAAGGVYVVRDGQTVSTAELAQALAGALGRRARLLTLPVPLLTFAAALAGRRGALERLTGSLRVDDTKMRNGLGWRPPYTLQQGLRETAAWFIATYR